MILSRDTMLHLLRRGELVVEPFSDDIVRENGLDLRLGDQYCRLRGTRRIVVDSRSLENLGEAYSCWRADSLLVEPGSRYLLHTLEYIRLPNYIAGLVNLRSTFARLGLYIPPTVVDAGFEGQLTIELASSTFPVKLHAGDRFLHLILVRLDAPTTPYKGKYQGQRGVTLPR